MISWTYRRCAMLGDRFSLEHAQEPANCVFQPHAILWKTLADVVSDNEKHQPVLHHVKS